MIGKVLKMIFNYVESFHRNSLLYTCFGKFWVVENSFPIVTKLNGSNIQIKAKSISTFTFTALCMKTPHNLHIEVLSEVLNFVFKSNVQSHIGFSNTSVYWTSKGCWG